MPSSLGGSSVHAARRTASLAACSTRWWRARHPGLLRAGEHAGIGVRLVNGRLVRRGPAERGAEVPELDARKVLDQAEEVGSCRNERPSDVVLRQPIELAQDGLPRVLQVLVQVCRAFLFSHGWHPVTGA
jgi:hypothetical protein